MKKATINRFMGRSNTLWFTYRNQDYFLLLVSNDGNFHCASHATFCWYIYYRLRLDYCKNVSLLNMTWGMTYYFDKGLLIKEKLAFTFSRINIFAYSLLLGEPE